MALTNIPSTVSKGPASITDVPSAPTDVPTHAGMTRVPDVASGPAGTWVNESAVVWVNESAANWTTS